MRKVISLMAAVALGLAGGCSKSSETADNSCSAKKFTIALMPKSKGNAYFISCKQGADQAAKESLNQQG